MQFGTTRGLPVLPLVTPLLVLALQLLMMTPPAAARVYTLEECIEVALIENTTLARAREDLR
ncbi:hypothetical protein KAT82_00090, partial [bacterium]|nr:hypothetical protein [bacterium]